MSECGCVCPVAVCPFPVFRRASISSGIAPQWSGMFTDATALPQRCPTPVPHVPHHHRLFTGEKSLCSHFLCVRVCEMLTIHKVALHSM